MKLVAGILAVAFAAALTYGQWSAQQQTDVPAFHAAPPAPGDRLPPILTQQQLANSGYTMPAQKESYKAAAAAKMSSVLYQQPCYCHCDRHKGHTSLRSCFEDTHGANCGTCMAEALYSYQKSKEGWSPKQIRDGIMRNEFTQIDLQNPRPVN
jgi:hypothetical protein